MPKQEIKIELTLSYDPEQNENKPVHIFLFQFLTRLNREWPILDIVYKGKKKTFRKGEDINNIALRKVDSVDDKELPTPPAWLKDKTVVPQEPRVKKVIK